MPNHAVVVWWLSAMAGLLVGCNSKPPEPAPEHKRGEAILRASAAIRQVCEIAAKNDDYNLSEATNESLKRIVRDTPHTSEELGAIAMACKALALSGDEERCGFVLEAASEYCIGLLSERTDEDARDALHGLEVDLYRDGGDALIIHEAIERQEELIKSGVPGESRAQDTEFD